MKVSHKRILKKKYFEKSKIKNKFLILLTFLIKLI